MISTKKLLTKLYLSSWILKNIRKGNIRKKTYWHSLKLFNSISTEGDSNSDVDDQANQQKDVFSLQDVMELTLLHAQQMQILQGTYE
jgi:hypothetical protein